VILVVMVFRWVGDYRENAAKQRAAAASQEQTPTPEPAEKGSGSASGGDAKTTDKTSAKPTIIIVDIEGLNFRPKADPKAKPIRGLSKGEELTLIAQKDTWYHVKASDGTKGWVTAAQGYTSIREP
jgi:uncharacterized protein YgiM (DUF1202 family)